MRRLAPLDRGLPSSVPTLPRSQLPQIEDPERGVRFVGTAARKPANAPTAAEAAAAAAARARAEAAEGAGQVSLYAFNVEELYDYDLPNIRRPSEALTAMTMPKLRGAQSRKRLPPLDAAAPAVADASGEGDGEGEGEAKLKTGDEAANFFARHGNHTPVKFVYLNRAKTGDTFKPYELVVVPREQREAEHFTMSACGVVHVYSSEQPSEFVTLSTWMQQARPPPPPPPPRSLAAHPPSPPAVDLLQRPLIHPLLQALPRRQILPAVARQRAVQAVHAAALEALPPPLPRQARVLLDAPRDQRAVLRAAHRREHAAHGAALAEHPLVDRRIPRRAGAVQRSAVQRSAAQCSAVQCSAVQCSAVIG